MELAEADLDLELDEEEQREWDAYEEDILQYEQLMDTFGMDTGKLKEVAFAPHGEPETYDDGGDEAVPDDSDEAILDDSGKVTPDGSTFDSFLAEVADQLTCGEVSRFKQLPKGLLELLESVELDGEQDKCSNCGNVFVLADSAFCRKCGTPRTAKTESAERCRKCGNVFMHDSLFCRKCGNPRDVELSGEASAAESVAAQAKAAEAGVAQVKAAEAEAAEGKAAGAEWAEAEEAEAEAVNPPSM